jgi:hypothetical protein
MSSEKQLAANRRNAQKSTGPTSVAGKAASSMNALKTGAHAKSAVIKGENAAGFQQLIDEYYAHYQPQTPIQRAVLDDLINTEWLLRRLTVAEAQMWNHQMEASWSRGEDHYPIGKAASNNHKAHAAMQRRLDSTRRARARAIESLRDLARNPIPLPQPQPAAAPGPATLEPPTTSTPIGFVPSTSPAPTMSHSPLQGRIKNCLTSS